MLTPQAQELCRRQVLFHCSRTAGPALPRLPRALVSTSPSPWPLCEKEVWLGLWGAAAQGTVGGGPGTGPSSAVISRARCLGHGDVLGGGRVLVPNTVITWSREKGRLRRLFSLAGDLSTVHGSTLHATPVPVAGDGGGRRSCGHGSLLPGQTRRAPESPPHPGGRGSHAAPLPTGSVCAVKKGPRAVRPALSCEVAAAWTCLRPGPSAGRGTPSLTSRLPVRARVLTGFGSQVGLMGDHRLTTAAARAAAHGYVQLTEQVEKRSSEPGGRRPLFVHSSEV